MASKFLFIILIALILAIESLPRHLPIIRKSILENVDNEYSDIILQHKSEAIKAYLERMDKESAIAGRPRFGRSFLTRLVNGTGVL